MARAYKKTYLNGAMRNLAVMMDCGVRKYGYTIGEFYQKFLSSCVSRRSFAFMQRKGLGADTVVSMYHPLHEADLSKFAEVANGILTEGAAAKVRTNLAEYLEKGIVK